MSKKPNPPSSNTTSTPAIPHKGIVNVDEQESSHEANLKSKSENVSIGSPKNNKSKKVAVGSRTRNNSSSLSSPPIKEALCPELNTLSELPLQPIRVDTQASKVIEDTDINPKEREAMVDESKTLEASFANAADPIALGNAVRTARLNAGLSQSQLETKSSVSKWNISKIERGSGGTLQNMEKIAKATNTTLQIRFSPESK